MPSILHGSGGLQTTLASVPVELNHPSQAHPPIQCLLVCGAPLLLFLLQRGGGGGAAQPSGRGAGAAGA